MFRDLVVHTIVYIPNAKLTGFSIPELFAEPLTATKETLKTKTTTFW